jgi:hypothetical protein
MKTLFGQAKWLCCFLFICVISSCQDESLDLIDEADSHNHVEQNSKIISGYEIPHVMAFIESISTEDRVFQLENNSLGKSTSELGVITIEDDQIIQLTNEFDKSNYSFKTKSEGEEFSIVQFVVKETSWGLYGFFVKFIPTADYLTSYNLETMDLYSGVIELYDQSGVFVASHTFDGGLEISKTVVDPCDTNTGPGGSGGTTDSGDTGDPGDTGDGSTSGDTGDTGDSGSSGTGGYNITITRVCGCKGHPGGNNGPVCSGCNKPDVLEITITNKSGGLGPLVAKCDGTTDPNCNIDCEFGEDPDPEICACVPDPNDPSNENQDTGVQANLILLSALMQYVDLTLEQRAWIQDSESPENLLFAQQALIAFQEGGTADFDDLIIYHRSIYENAKVKSVFAQLRGVENSYFRTTLEDIFEGLTGAHIQFSVKDNVVDIGTGTPVELPAYTTPSTVADGSKLFVIDIDPDFIEESSIILIATAILHEVVHAEIFQRLRELGIIEIHTTTEGDFNIEFLHPDYLTYNSMFDLAYNGLGIYMDEFDENPEWAHNLFNLLYYRNMLSTEVSDFHQSYDDSDFISLVESEGYSMSEIYEVLGWFGLNRTSEYESLTEEQRDFIRSITEFVKENSTHSID